MVKPLLIALAIAIALFVLLAMNGERNDVGPPCQAKPEAADAAEDWVRDRMIDPDRYERQAIIFNDNPHGIEVS